LGTPSICRRLQQTVKKASRRKCMPNSTSPAHTPSRSRPNAVKETLRADSASDPTNHATNQAKTGRATKPGAKRDSKKGSNQATDEAPDHKADGAASQATTQTAKQATGRTTTRAGATDAVSADVLARAQAGDHQAFALVYSLHKRRIYSLCLRMVGNVAEAEDLTQEAFLQLHRKIATFRGDSAFSTWLHRLAINVVLMQLRKKGLSLISLDEAMEPTPDEGPSRSFGAPDLTLTGAIDRLALERAVADLPTGYRLIFILHDVEGFEHNEIAAMLDCSIGNSKSQLHKARLKLRDALRIQKRQEEQP
jgi:RNA polymerase sigma-70 factor (ECF subfamily)